MMAAETALVALIVGASLVYAVWALMPSAARRSLARALVGLPLPAVLARRFTQIARAASGCSCDGCDRAPATAAMPRRGEQTIRFHPSVRR